MTKLNDKQPGLISVANEPIPGTSLHRRWQSGQEVSPVFQGDAPNEMTAIEQAQATGQRSVTFGDTTYVEVGGSWYGWAFPPEREGRR